MISPFLSRPAAMPMRLGKPSTFANKPSSVSESNDIIFNALLGIVLLFGAYILLNTINPELTRLEIPKPQQINVEKNTTRQREPTEVWLSGQKEIWIMSCGQPAIILLSKFGWRI